MTDENGSPKQVAFVDYFPSAANATSFTVKVGLRPPPPTLSSGTVDTLQMLGSDTEIDVHVFYDNGLAEVFFMKGRVVMTQKIAATAQAGFLIYSDGVPMDVVCASAWRAGSTWVPKAQLC